MFTIRQRIFRRLEQRGDTLVEVLLSIAIISTILSGAYIVTNKSLIASRESQERGNAVKLSQGQIERLKTISIGNDAAKLFAASLPAKFCISDTNDIRPIIDNTCNVNAQGVHDGIEPIYHFSIIRTGNLFELTTTWESLKSSEKNSVQLSYRVYQ